MKNLYEQTINLPMGPGQPAEEFTMKELGIGFVVLVHEPRIEHDYKLKNPLYEPTTTDAGSEGYGQFGGGEGGPTMGPVGIGQAPGAKPSEDGDGTGESDGETEEDPDILPFYDAPRFDFVVQFCWQEHLLTERLKKKYEEDQASTGEDTGADTSGAEAPTGG